MDTRTEVDIIRLIWRGRKILIGVWLGVVALVGLYLCFAERYYDEEVLVIPNQAAIDLIGRGKKDILSLNPLSGVLGKGQLTGVHAEAATILQSIHFLASFVKKENILPVLFADKWDESRHAWDLDADEVPPTPEAGARYFKKHLLDVQISANADEIRIIVTWNNAEQGAKLANALVTAVNDDVRHRYATEARAHYQAILALMQKPGLPLDVQAMLASTAVDKLDVLTMANVEPDFAFKVIDPALPITQPSFPKVFITLAVAIVLGAFVGVFAVFLVHGVRFMRKAIADDQVIPSDQPGDDAEAPSRPLARTAAGR